MRPVLKTLRTAVLDAVATFALIAVALFALSHLAPQEAEAQNSGQAVQVRGVDANGRNTPVGVVGNALKVGGVAEDDPHASGDPLAMAGCVRRDAAATTTSAAVDNSATSCDSYGVVYSRGDHPNRWNAGVDNIGATLTEVVGNPGAGLSLYIRTIVAGSTTTTAGQFLLRRGTGTNCGTGTTTIFPGTATTTPRAASPANTSNPTVITFDPPLKITANNAVCLLGVATNTTWAEISGFTAP